MYIHIVDQSSVTVWTLFSISSTQQVVSILWAQLYRKYMATPNWGEVPGHYNEPQVSMSDNRVTGTTSQL